MAYLEREGIPLTPGQEQFAKLFFQWVESEPYAKEFLGKVRIGKTFVLKVISDFLSDSLQSK